MTADLAVPNQPYTILRVADPRLQELGFLPGETFTLKRISWFGSGGTGVAQVGASVFALRDHELKNIFVAEKQQPICPEMAKAL
jgi:Fe2+ transport system protein FeoA